MKEILSKNLASRAARLRIASISLSEGIRSGNFRSASRGQGIEFSDVREYIPGDNVRAIDWNVTARMGRAFIKQYEEDRELNVLVVLDCSRSMFSGSSDGVRIVSACEVAALAVLASERNSGASGAVFFDGSVRFSCPPKPGRENALSILSKIDRLEFPSGAVNGSALSSALRCASNLLRKRSLVFVISDFRAAGWEKELAFLSCRNDVIAVRISDSTDSELPVVGTVPFSDSETGASAVLPTSSSAFARAWFEANRRRVDSWEELCAKHGAHTLVVSTAEDSVLALSRFFAKRRSR